MNPAAILMQDEEITALADSLIEIHASVVSTRGLSLGDSVSQEKMNMISGRLESAIRAAFDKHFGEPPSALFPDVFSQIAHFSLLLAKDHIFADGNKRTTMIACFSLLKECNITIDALDSPSSQENEVYRQIQRLVADESSETEFAEFLRSHAR